MWFINISSIFSDKFISFSGSIIPSLTPLQKKVSLVIAVLFIVLAALFYLMPKAFGRTPQVNNLDDLSEDLLDQPLVLEETYRDVLDKTPEFAAYKVTPAMEEHVLAGIGLTAFNLRPANLFFAALFKGTGITTTMPGSGSLFAFSSTSTVKDHCKQKATEDPEGEVSFSAAGVPGFAAVLDPASKKYKRHDIDDLGEIYGTNTYRMSYQEIQETLDSQKIYLSSLLPRAFYSGLKEAMQADEIVILPGNDKHPKLLNEFFTEKSHMADFVRKARINPLEYGFSDQKHFDYLSGMTLYQIGSLVVKIEDYRIFADGKGQILERNVGEQDQVRLINACGIRGFHSAKTPKNYTSSGATYSIAITAEEAEMIRKMRENSKTPPNYNKTIMTETFKTALAAAESGICVFPAVGMGVWGGDPDLYWRAFLDGVIASEDKLETIFINPGHQTTRSGKYKGCKGEELDGIIKEYRAFYKDNKAVIEKLDRIINLYESKKDLLQLARELKQAHPEKIVSIFNASDPDVTLGYHVGEYTNNLPHGASTTEEHYTALGSNGICREEITGVHEFPDRIIQMQ